MINVSDNDSVISQEQQ